MDKEKQLRGTHLAAVAGYFIVLSRYVDAQNSHS
jgi:hypothetical protein